MKKKNHSSSFAGLESFFDLRAMKHQAGLSGFRKPLLLGRGLSNQY